MVLLGDYKLGEEGDRGTNFCFPQRSPLLLQWPVAVGMAATRVL